MPGSTRAKFSKDALLRIAKEQAGLTLSDADAEALVTVVENLLGFADQVVARPRRDVDPSVAFALGDWTND